MLVPRRAVDGGETTVQQELHSNGSRLEAQLSRPGHAVSRLPTTVCRRLLNFGGGTRGLRGRGSLGLDESPRASRYCMKPPTICRVSKNDDDDDL